MSRKIYFEFSEDNSALLLAAVRHAKMKAECATDEMRELETEEAALQMKNYYTKLQLLERHIVYEIQRQLYPS